VGAPAALTKVREQKIVSCSYPLTKTAHSLMYFCAREYNKHYQIFTTNWLKRLAFWLISVWRAN
jgi:hypothetical protein